MTNVLDTDSWDKDKQLMVRFQNGNLYAYDALFKKYFPEIVRSFSYNGNMNKQDAEDIAQRTLIGIYTRKNSYRPEIPFKFITWISKIAINLVRTEFRKQERRKTLDILIYAYFMDGNREEEDQIYYKSGLEKIMDEIQKLTPKYRTALILRVLNNSSYENVSKILDVPIGTVKSRVNRAKKILKEEIREEYWR